MPFVDIEKLCKKDYLGFYTVDCLNRSSNRSYNNPESISLFLSAVSHAVGSNNAKIPVNGIISFFTKYKKYGEATYKGLANMSAQPFPLIQTGRSPDENSSVVNVQPLVSEQNGWVVGQRYARVCLSTLGQYATRWFNSKVDDPINPPISLVPITLLRHSLPISLGIKEEMFSLNPSEMFNLMIKMIDHKSQDLPAEDINAIFKGVDVGENYISYNSDTNIKYLWSVGRASCIVVPDIEIDRTNNIITIKRPQCGSVSTKLRTRLLEYIKEKLIEGEQPFDTFVPSINVSVNGSETFFTEVKQFVGSDEEIKKELWELPFVQKVVQLSNLQSYTDNRDLNEIVDGYSGDDRYDEALKTKIKLDIVPIKETLWFHLSKEYEQNVKHIQAQIDALNADISLVNLIEKITRDGVKEHIQSILLKPNKRDLLYNEFNENSTSSNKLNYMADTSLTTDEVELVFKERDLPTIQGKRINLLAILTERQKYLNEFQALLNELNALKNKLQTPDLILADIRKDLQYLASLPEHQRKTKANFIRDAEVELAQLPLQDNIKYNSIFDRVKVPLTLYYTDNTIIKSVGRNINTDSFELVLNKPLKILNVCSTDTVLIVTGSRVYTKTVTEISTTDANYTNIKFIVPVENKPIVAIYNSLKYNLSKIIYYQNPRELRNITDYTLVDYIYYNGTDEYIDILTSYNFKFLCGRFNIEELMGRVTPAGDLPVEFGNIFRAYIVPNTDSITRIYPSNVQVPISSGAIFREMNKFYEIPDYLSLDDNEAIETYLGKYFIPNPSLYGYNAISLNKYKKRGLITESTDLLTSDNRNLSISLCLKQLYTDGIYNRIITLYSRSSESYINYDIEYAYPHISNLIDKRFLVLGKHWNELDDDTKNYIKEYYNKTYLGEDLSQMDTPQDYYYKTKGMINYVEI